MIDKEQLKKLQKIEASILLRVDAFCGQNCIKYSLYEGSAIGAIRHHGFVPWDDDIDICMKRKDFERFQDLWHSHPIEGLFMQGTRKDDHSNINHIKICKDNTIYASFEEYKRPVHHGVWIDIFALDSVPQNNRDRKKQLNWAKIRIILTRDRVIPNGGKTQKIVSKLLVSLPNRIKNRLKEKAEKEVTKYSDCDDCICLKSFNSVAGINSSRGFPSNCMDHFTTVEFEGYQISISTEYDEMLRRSFGNYMELPPIEKRVPSHNADIIQL